MGSKELAPRTVPPRPSRELRRSCRWEPGAGASEMKMSSGRSWVASFSLGLSFPVQNRGQGNQVVPNSVRAGEFYGATGALVLPGQFPVVRAGAS